MDLVNVQAVPGRLCPHPSGRGFIGWVQCEAGEAAEHTVPGGFGFIRATSPVAVPNVRMVRMAIKRGDIELVTTKAKKGGE